VSTKPISAQHSESNFPVRVALDRAGRIVAVRRFSQVMTSWAHLYELLVPKYLYHSGVTLERIEQNDARVTALSRERRARRRRSVDWRRWIALDGTRSVAARTQTILPGLHRVALLDG
jgi:hypothetical protein